MIGSGELNERILIQKNNPVKDEYGSLTDNWEDIARTNAKIIFTKGSKRVIAGETVDTRAAEMRIRIYHKIDPKMRIIHCGLKYSIESAFPNRDLGAWVINTLQINE